MAKLPLGDYPRLVTSEAPQSTVSASQIAAPHAQLADALDKTGGALMDVAEPIAEQAGYKAVTRDADGNVQVEKMPMFGRAADAYGRAVKVAALADGEGAARRADLDLREKHRDDPEAYLKAAEAFRDTQQKQYTTAAGPEVGLAIGRAIDQNTTQSYRGLLNEKQRLDLQRSVVSIESRISTAENDAAVKARGGVDYREDLETVRALRTELLKNPRLAYPPEKLNFDMTQFESNLKVAELSGRVVGDGGVYEKQGYEAALKEADRIKTDPTLNLSTSQRTDAANKIRAEVNLKRSGEALLLRQNVQMLDAVEKDAADGVLPNPEQRGQLRAAINATNNPELIARLAATERIVSFSESARQMRPDQLEAEVSVMNRQIAERGGSPEAIAMRDAGNTMLKNMRTELSTDPLGWAEKTGVQKVPGLNFADPAVGGQMMNRVAVAESVASYYGTTPVYLRPGERAFLESAASTGGAPMLQMAQVISRGFGDRTPQVMREISKEAPVLAHVGGLMQTGVSQSFAQDVAEAVRLRQDKEFKLPRWLDKPSEKIMAAQGAQTRSVYGDAFLLAPDSARAAQASAQAAYFTRASRRGLDPLLEEGDSKKTYDKALQEAAGARFDAKGNQFGGVTPIGGGWFGGPPAARVIVPATVRADKFSQVLRSVGDADLTGLAVKPVGGDDKPLPARALQNAVPVAVAGGYRFSLGEPGSDDPKWVRGSDGKPFVLNFDAMEPVLRKRVPEAFVGGR